MREWLDVIRLAAMLRLLAHHTMHRIFFSRLSMA
jgi:hypothetical protein